MARHCAYQKENSLPCRAAPLKDGEFCLMHSPDHADDMAEARRLGGLRRRREVAVSGAFDFAGLGNVADIRRLLEVAVLDTLGLENSVSRARALAYLVTTAIKLLEVGDLEQRLASLETAINSRRGLPESVFDAENLDSGFPVEVEL